MATAAVNCCDRYAFFVGGVWVFLIKHLFAVSDCTDTSLSIVKLDI